MKRLHGGTDVLSRSLGIGSNSQNVGSLRQLEKRKRSKKIGLPPPLENDTQHRINMGGYVGSSEDNVGFPAVWEVLWVRATTMWVSRERFPEDFRREEKEKSDFRQEDDKEKREGKVFECARLYKGVDTPNDIFPKLCLIGPQTYKAVDRMINNEQHAILPLYMYPD
ncbi:hypothetical protein JHK86_018895 [Glycine max]|nr:hypothetical protein JHK86_018895 [Glycine max]